MILRRYRHETRNEETAQARCNIKLTHYHKENSFVLFVPLWFKYSAG